MNEFEWLQQTRALARPVEPAQDLWPDIAARLHTASHVHARAPSRALPWTMVATLAIFSLLVGGLAWRQTAAPTPWVTASVTTPATAPWKPRDPHLVGAAIELNIARNQLTRAIRRSPHNPFLRHMLAYTNAQVERLQQLPHGAG